MSGHPRIGADVYLTPRTIGAPGIAYKQPSGRVVHVAIPEVTVELADGARVTTHELNVSPGAPVPPRAKPRMLQRRNNAIDPKHGHEMSIEDFLGEPA